MIIAALVVCLAISVFLIVRSRTPKANGSHRTLFFVGIVFGVLSVLPLTALLALGVFWGEIPGPPSIASLARDFSARRVFLAEILRMSDEEPRLVRVDPTFMDSLDPATESGGPVYYGKPNKQLPKDRWDTYRALFHEAGLKQGFTRDDKGNVFFLADSAGMLDMGYSTGYLFCASNSSNAGDSRYVACTSGKDSGATQRLTANQNPVRSERSLTIGSF